jgi:hypothetical protein
MRHLCLALCLPAYLHDRLPARLPAYSPGPLACLGNFTLLLLVRCIRASTSLCRCSFVNGVRHVPVALTFGRLLYFFSSPANSLGLHKCLPTPATDRDRKDAGRRGAGQWGGRRERRLSTRGYIPRWAVGWLDDNGKGREGYVTVRFINMGNMGSTFGKRWWRAE